MARGGQGRGAHDHQVDWYWRRKFSPKQPDTATWTETQSIGAPFPMSESAGQTVLPTGIASAEALGTAQLNLTLYPTGTASAEAFGTAVVAGPITATGIASAEAFGTATVTASQTISPTGIASAEAFGTAVVAGPITATGIASAEAFGTATVSQTLSIYPSGIASAEAFGTTLVVGPITATGIASAEAFGTAQLNLTLYPTGTASAEAFGTASVSLTISPTGIASAEAFGTASVVGPVIATGIASAEAFGTAQLNLEVRPNGVASAEAFGTATLGVAVLPTGIASAEAFGTATVNTSILATGIASAEAFGATVVAGPITATGIASAEAFGTPALGVFISPTGIASAEAFGTTSVAQVVATGIASAEAFGTAQLNLTLYATGVSTEEAFGTASVMLTVSPTGIASEEAFGATTLHTGIMPTGIESAEAFGATAVAGPITVPGIATAEAFGTAFIYANADLTIEPATVALRAAPYITLAGTMLNTFGAEPNLSDGIIDPGLWTDVSTGVGSVVEQATSQTLLFDTGSTANSTAALRTINAESTLDVEFSAVPVISTTSRSYAFTLSTLRLYISATTYFDLAQRVVSGRREVRATAVGNGVTMYDRLISRSAASGNARLRLLRIGARVWVFVGGQLVAQPMWTTGAANIEVRVTNDPTKPGRVRTTLTEYERRPVVQFGTEPILDLVLFSGFFASGRLPQLNKLGLVDVTVTAPNDAVTIIPEAFTVTLDPATLAVVKEPGVGSLYFIGDAIVRR